MGPDRRIYARTKKQTPILRRANSRSPTGDNGDVEVRQQSEDRFHVVPELLPDGFSILQPVRNSQGRVLDFAWVYVNSATKHIIGMKLPALAGRSLLETFPGYHGSPFFETYQQVAETGTTSIREAPYEDDAILGPRWFRVAVISMGQNIAVLSQDISEHKRAEAALRESEAKF